MIKELRTICWPKKANVCVFNESKRIDASGSVEHRANPSLCIVMLFSIESGPNKKNEQETKGVDDERRRFADKHENKRKEKKGK